MQDTHRRHIDYLRISVTDRCNERCTYCMPAGYSDWLPHDRVLSYEQIERIVRVAVTMGFSRFRITGGEPLVRADIVEFIERIGSLPGVERLSMTTNGTRLATVPGVADRLRRAGLSSVNISLDSLDAESYRQITRGRLDEALAGIDAAAAAGFDRLKLNVVLMRGLNEDQLYPICRYAADRRIDAVRFIELMPVSDPAMIAEDRFLPIAAATRLLGEHDTLEKVSGTVFGDGPAKYMRLAELGLSVGFIGAMTDDHFCESCNKMRLTADGFIRPCLGNHGEIDLNPALREHHTDDALVEAFTRALTEKPLDHSFRDHYTPLRIMTAIGG